MRKVIIPGMAAIFFVGISAIFWFSGRRAENASLAQEMTRYSAPAPLPGGPLQNAAVQSAVNDQQDLTPDERVNIRVYQIANRSVVNINTKGISADQFMMFRILAEGEGSGCVLDKQGHILTNYHVVNGAQEIGITLFDGSTHEAQLVGGDPATDVAVLKIDAPAELLYPVNFGNSANLLVGQRVFAIGNPFGFERTLSTGIISSLNRMLPVQNTDRHIKSVIQIDAAINPGNSGGPLLDSHARMIGMNTAIASKTGESAGVGFAIPINTIARVVPQLIAEGHVRRPESGIAKVFPTERGLLVIGLTPGGPAERAGLRGPRIEHRQKRQGVFVQDQKIVKLSAADLIVAVDGHPVKTAADFLDNIEEKQPGNQVVLTVLRDGKQQQIPLQLGENEE
jgi:S1-C subfamily serine protease